LFPSRPLHPLEERRNEFAGILDDTRPRLVVRSDADEAADDEVTASSASRRVRAESLLF